MTVTAAQARRLLLDAQGLCADPARAASATEVMKVVSQLGFVQLDSIQRIERAHHLILGARLDGYRQDTLHHLAFEKRALFEHWTHDAALIPTLLYGLWKPRFTRWEKKLRSSKWFSNRLGTGTSATRAINKVLTRVTRDGPTRARDFDRGDHGRATGWWDWTPEKTALEYLWHTGTLAITSRDGCWGSSSCAAVTEPSSPMVGAVAGPSPSDADFPPYLPHERGLVELEYELARA